LTHPRRHAYGWPDSSFITFGWAAWPPRRPAGLVRAALAGAVRGATQITKGERGASWRPASPPCRRDQPGHALLGRHEELRAALAARLALAAGHPRPLPAMTVTSPGPWRRRCSLPGSPGTAPRSPCTCPGTCRRSPWSPRCPAVTGTWTSGTPPVTSLGSPGVSRSSFDPLRKGPMAAGPLRLTLPDFI